MRARRVVTLLYIMLLSREGVVREDVASVVGIASSLLAATLSAVIAASSSNRRVTIVLVTVALVPLLVWGVLGVMTIGALFLVAAGFLVAALAKVSSSRD